MSFRRSAAAGWLSRGPSRLNRRWSWRMNRRANLDSRTSEEVMGLLQMTSRQFHQTMIMITHNEEIAQLADRIIHLEDGRIVGGGGHVR